MPFYIQYDGNTGQILATVSGKGEPDPQGIRKQISFPVDVPTWGKMVDLTVVVEDTDYTLDDVSVLKDDQET